MSSEKERDVLALVVEVARELREQEVFEYREELGRDTPLLGRDGVLESLELVRLVVAVEQAIEDEYGVAVSLADERAMSQKASPYRSIGTLTEYARKLVEEADPA